MRLTCYTCTTVYISMVCICIGGSKEGVGVKIENSKFDKNRERIKGKIRERETVINIHLFIFVC